MFNKYLKNQRNKYAEAYDYFTKYPNGLIEAEKFVMNQVNNFIDIDLPEIIRDYNEASYLHPFWKNYSPLDRGRKPIGDQFPWIEVGEKVFGSKLSRYFSLNFAVKHSGIPSGADERCIISKERLKNCLVITDSVWVFIDIKSTGPRDAINEAVLSPYQVSGSGNWDYETNGIKNDPIKAKGCKREQDFYCSLAPIYVLSDGTIAPLLTFVVKPIYRMEKDQNDMTIGQPLERIEIACVPNGLLLTKNPNYIKQFPGLFYPGKDGKDKAAFKCRARVNFEILKQIADWRVKEVKIR